VRSDRIDVALWCKEETSAIAVILSEAKDLEFLTSFQILRFAQNDSCH
jgi:hypothetical protein